MEQKGRLDFLGGDSLTIKLDLTNKTMMMKKNMVRTQIRRTLNEEILQETIDSKQ